MSAPVEAVAVRAWTTPDYALDEPSSFTDLGPSERQLIFDVETWADLGQQRRLLAWQERKGGRLRRIGLAYDPAQLTEEEIAVVLSFAADHKLRLLTIEEFVHKVFFNIGWSQRGTIIGFNLPFDLSRLAIGHSATKPHHRHRSMRGGWSFQLSANEALPRVQVKRINGRAAFVRFATSKGNHPEARNRRSGGAVANHRGYFVDAGIAAGALFGRRFSLDRLATLLQTATQKGSEKHGEKITSEYLQYALDDVQVTWECYEKIAARYAAYPLDTPLHRIYSEASIGKAHLRQMALQPWRQTQPEAPDWLLAAIMETYYGGRTECHIRRVAMPGVATDVTSEYPTTFVLQHLWPFLVAERMGWAEEDPAVVAEQLTELTVARLLDPAFWPQLTRLVQLAPDGDQLPTRADFAGTGTFNLAISERVGGPAQWFTYADVIASWLATSRVPGILRVLQFTPGPPQPGLRPIALAGRSEFTIHAAADDLIKGAVELRAEIRGQAKAARSADPQQADALDGQQQGTKIVATSVSYGAPIEVNVIEHRRGQPVTVHLPDGGSYRASSRRIEEPGRFFHPLVATLVAGGGRLLLALIMRMVADRGGTYVFCDTDSLFIVATETGGLLGCPGGPHRLADGTAAVLALSWAQVNEIVEELTALNPYGAPLAGKSVLKVEDENFDPETGRQRQIYALSIASKRYAPLLFDPDGRPVLLRQPGKTEVVYKRSEHGLGHLLDPLDQQPDSEDPRWRDEWWTQLLHDELGIPRSAPEWFDTPAVGRLSVSSRHEETNFRAYNDGRPYAEQTRPFNFGMMAFPTDGQAGDHGVLIAPLVNDPTQRNTMAWYSRGNPGAAPVRVRTGDAAFPIPGTVVVQSYGEIYDGYRRHPENKAAGADGRPCLPETRGLLQPRTVTARNVLRIGKEANRLADTEGPVDAEHDRPVVYGAPRCSGCELLVEGKRKWCSEACRKRATRRRVYR